MRDAMHHLSESQLRFWRGHQLQPTVPLYNMAWRFDLFLDLEADAFLTALRDVAAQSDILRAVFHEVDGLPMQSVSDTALDIALPIECAGEAELSRHMADWVRAPFDLTQGTFRSRLVRMGASHWVWVLCQHHIACDAQSGAVFFKQVSEQYAKRLSGETTAPALLPYFSSSACAAHTAAAPQTASHIGSPPYGAAKLREAWSDRIDLPFGPDLQNKLSTAINSAPFRLFTPDMSRLALLLTGYAAYLHRVTGDEFLTIGLPSHNRRSEADRNTLGLFVEVLPLPIEVQEADSFTTLHNRVKDALGAFLRKARPGAIAREDTRSISAVLNFIQARFDHFAGQPARVEWIHSGAHDAEHALRLHVTDFAGDGSLNVSMDVNHAVLEQTAATAVKAHFHAIMAAMLESPDRAIRAVPLTQARDDFALLEGPAEQADLSATVLDLFDAQRRSDPEAIALRGAGPDVSYAELDAQAEQVAEQLAPFGPGACIAVHLPRSYDCVAAILGVLKARCAFVPIAAHTPFGRTNDILKGCDAAAVFVSDENGAAYTCPSLRVGDAAEHSTLSPPAPSELAYVLFTSGSTGVPKGVSVTHQNLSRYVQWAGRSFGGGRADYPFFSSISFDLTLTSLFAPLTTGGSIVVYPETSTPDLAILDVFAQDAVDVVKLTPSHLSLVCAQANPVKRMRTLVLGGENLTKHLCDMALDALSPDLRIINEYGPTEAVVGAMEHVYEPEQDAAASVQIGTPAPGVSISVRDTRLNPCPIGVRGEIVIGGRLAEGYLGQEAMTEAQFVDDPAGFQGRIYKTGDLGRLRKDGAFEYLGRADQQVKLGGVRLELAEIENTVRAVPGVDAVHVGFVRKQMRVARQHCVRCGLPDTFPGASFSDDGLCMLCTEFDTYKARAQVYFRPEPELTARIANAAVRSTGRYDAVMLLSGGKDSTYAAYRLAEHADRVLAVTLDNGYIADGAKANINRVVADLGWDHRYLSTPKMNDIFVDSLKTHSNVCQGCFKAIYTLALRTARAEGATMIVTGLSRGQFFETRLTPELFRKSTPTCAELDDLVSRARRTYHAEDDAVARLLETEDLKDGRALDEVEILDIYRYIDVPVSEIYAFLDHHTAWRRPSDTGRSTNCLINDVGIHLHKSREGFHNYALPYSWDVRMGHKTRAQAMAELDDEIDTGRVDEILDEIGFDEPITPDPALTVYITGVAQEEDVWAALEAQLPREMLPKHVMHLETMPLTANGKVDTSKLPAPRKREPVGATFVAPETEMEHRLAPILCAALRVPQISVIQNFFDLGVDSLTAVEIAMKALEDGVEMRPTALFEHRTLRALAASCSDAITEETAETEDLLLDLDDSDFASIAQALN